jgi:cytoskeletal protein CcmA (bactofilin family)
MKGCGMVLSVKKTSSTIETVIGENTVCDGILSCETNLRVEGKVIGDIQCTGEVMIGEHAVVESTISAKDIVIAGTVHGNVSAKGRLTILPTGQLIGSIEADVLQVAEGGVFLGNCTMAQKSPVNPITGKNKDTKPHKQQKQQSQEQAAANAV